MAERRPRSPAPPNRRRRLAARARRGHGRPFREPSRGRGFALGTLRDPTLAWQLAHVLVLVLEDDDTWVRVADAYRRVDPVATVRIYSRVAADTLVATDVRAYKQAAKLLARAQDLADGTAHEGEITDLVAELRETYKRRRRMLQEFDRAGLP